jgi:hypothetical protein
MLYWSFSLRTNLTDEPVLLKASTLTTHGRYNRNPGDWSGKNRYPCRGSQAGVGVGRLIIRFIKNAATCYIPLPKYTKLRILVTTPPGNYARIEQRALIEVSEPL